MEVETSEETRRAVLMGFLKTLEHLPECRRGAAVLNMSAELLETAAYELAGPQSSPRVARLILISAEVSRFAAAVGDDTGDMRRVC